MQTQDQNLETGLVQFFLLDAIRPSPQNDLLYRPIDPNDPELRGLAASIHQHGILDPLVITCDRVILSGHRRHAAAGLAGLKEVPCHVEAIHSSDPQFLTLLREYNRQRDKTDAERLREEIVTASPQEAYRRLREHRQQNAAIDGDFLKIEGEKVRSGISKGRGLFLNAVIAVLADLRPFWPVSVRQIHYRLLNNPPLVHASKPDSVYANTLACYKSLSDLTTRARLRGIIPMQVISDETRPVIASVGFDTVRPFLRQEINGFLKGFYRNLQQTQPNHIEIVGEKQTVLGVLKPIAEEFCIPLTIGRGYSSLPPRHAMAERFKKSGKENLILLTLSDLDPDGEEIFHSFARSLRDDFGIDRVQAVKVALTQAHVQQFGLVPQMQAKETSTNYKKFKDKHGSDVYELEAIPPAALQELLREAICSVMDVDAYNAQIDREQEDAAFLDGVRQQVHLALKERGIGEDE